MTRHIYVLEHDGNLRRMENQTFANEDLLQRLLADHPEILGDSSDLSDDSSEWLLVRREAGIAGSADSGSRWSVDHLFLDREGVPTLVETKRSSDTRLRREVVGQMLDYAANCVAYWSPQQVRTYFEEMCRELDVDPEQRLTDFLSIGEDEIDLEEFWTKVDTNLEAEKLRLVFVADIIPPELQRIIEFLNGQMRSAEVVGIEVQQYVSGEARTLVPRRVGQTERARQQKKASGGGVRWDRASFLEALRRRTDEETTRRGTVLLDWAEQNADIWWSEGVKGSLVAILEHEGVKHHLFRLASAGRLGFYFNYESRKPPFDDEELRRQWLNRLNSITGVSISESRLSKTPTVNLDLLDETQMPRMLEILNWVKSTIVSKS